MPPVFDAYLMVDWSAAGVPRTGADSIWVGIAERRDGALEAPRLFNPPTRHAAGTLLADLLSDLVARDRVTLAGFDFAFGYPRGFARMLAGDGADWRTVWKAFAARLQDGEDNANNRFAAAADLNREISGRPFPFWGCPATAAGDMLTQRRPPGFGADLNEYRICDRQARGPHSVWKLAYNGSVGSQSLLGIAFLERLRRHPWLMDRVTVWPFETGLRPLTRPAEDGWRVLLAEIYPSILPYQSGTHAVKDANQVATVLETLPRWDASGRLTALFGGPAGLSQEDRRAVEQEEAWILAIETAAPKAGVAPTEEYLRDPEEIYRRSFAIIRDESDLAAFPADIEPVAVRIIHAAGDPAIAGDLAWSDGAATAGRAALAAGAPILVDTEMVAHGIIRSRLPANNAVICTLTEPGIAEAAEAQRTTRSAAAVDRWRDRLEGAVVAVGNAPTALFRLLELVRDGAPKPALVLGFPVGFVGAAESKEALLANVLGVPFIALRGRRGGSAMAAAAVNALSIGAGTR